MRSRVAAGAPDVAVLIGFFLAREGIALDD